MAAIPASASSPSPPRTRRADRRFFRLLLAASSLYLLSGLFFAFDPTFNPTSARLLLWAITLGTVVSVPALGIILLAIHRSFGHPLHRRTNADALFAMTWPLLVVAASQVGGFWNTPLPLSHLLATALIAAVPLLVLAILVQNRGMASRRSWSLHRTPPTAST
jgi:MFS family permease